MPCQSLHYIYPARAEIASELCVCVSSTVLGTPDPLVSGTYQARFSLRPL